jgi:hypothetical protein
MNSPLENVLPSVLSRETILQKMMLFNTSLSAYHAIYVNPPLDGALSSALCTVKK